VSALGRKLWRSAYLEDAPSAIHENPLQLRLGARAGPLCEDGGVRQQNEEDDKIMTE